MRTLSCMRCTDLTEAQPRMGARDFPADGKLFVLAKNAHEAMHRLLIETHYFSKRERHNSWWR